MIIVCFQNVTTYKTDLTVPLVMWYNLLLSFTSAFANRPARTVASLLINCVNFLGSFTIGFCGSETYTDLGIVTLHTFRPSRVMPHGIV